MRVDFMIIGAQKSGTTSLAAQLAQHPELCFCRIKEPGYFHRVDDWEAGLDGYHQLYSPAEGQICGEASTMYTFLPEWRGTHARLFAYNPALKLIYVMRHPVDRAISNYAHNLVRGLEKAPPEIALFKDPGYINRSRYGVQITPYVELFGKTNVLLLIFEEYVANQADTLRTIARFLQVSPDAFPEGDAVALHKAVGELYLKYSLVDKMVGSTAFQTVRPHIPAAMRLPIRRLFANKLEEKPHIAPEVKQVLWQFLEGDVDTIEELLGRHLDIWRARDRE